MCKVIGSYKNIYCSNEYKFGFHPRNFQTKFIHEIAQNRLPNTDTLLQPEYLWNIAFAVTKEVRLCYLIAVNQRAWRLYYKYGL